VTQLRVLLVDDDPLVRTGLAMILGSAPDIEVVGQAGDGDEAVGAVRAFAPDIVLMDIRMRRMDGIAATAAVNAMPSPPKVLVLTTYDLDEYVFKALKAGASGFLLKDAPADRLLDAVRVVAAGDALLAPSITRRLIGQFARAARPSSEAIPPAVIDLTERELDVLRLVARGLSNAEIAAELTLGENTIKTHVGRMLGKLGLRDRVQAVVLAYECGLVAPEL
jgi:DNA-binding NarL/FixJ family response regulator